MVNIYEEISIFKGFFMAVRFVLGRSGSGKTSHCISSIVQALGRVEQDRPLVLLVPEQATYQAERAILAGGQIQGYHRLRVLSFDRLRFLLLHSNAARPEISRIGQEMIIHKILSSCRDSLTVFSDVAQTSGLAAKLAKVIVELHDCGNTADDIAQLAQSLKQQNPDNLTTLKFADIALIFTRYLQFIENKFINPDIQLTMACNAASHAHFLKDARLWVDGFAGFTIQQQNLLMQLLRAASQSEIALCLDPAAIDVQNPDPEALDPAGLFNQAERTYCQLVEIIKKSKLQLARPVVLEKPLRFADSPALRHVERNLFAAEARPQAKAKDSIDIAAAPNPRAEVEYVASRILKLVRTENYRFRDIAVIASDINSYRHYIEAAFRDYGIPFFIDRPSSLSTHPLARLIISALQTAVNGFCSTDIFALLKTGLSTVSSYESDILENYCLAFGIDNDDWTRDTDWNFAGGDDWPFDQVQINKIRRCVIAPLVKLKNALAGGDNEETITAGRFTGALWSFLESLDICDKLTGWGPDDRQLYDKLVNIFDELNEIFADEQLPAENFIAIIRNAFTKLTLKLIPPTLDEVLVGSIERSRHPNLKAVFLTGATQKQFPVAVSFDSILTDEDRTAAQSQDFVLAEKVAQQLAARQYLAYIAFTRPSRHLCISYPLMDPDAVPLERSTFVNNLESLFDDLRVCNIDCSGDLQNLYSICELEDILCNKLGKDAQTPTSVQNDLCKLLDDLTADDDFAPIGGRIRYALDYENKAVLDKSIADGIFGNSLSCSATRLGGFAACPYKHFTQYILKLKERQIFSFEPIDLGSFYHRLLDELFKRLKQQNKNFKTATDDELIYALHEQIATILKDDLFLSNFIKRSRHNTYIIESAVNVLEDCVCDIAQSSRAGAFTQTESELWFGDSTAQLCEFTTADGKKIILRGKIDRVDCAEIDGKCVAVVFDYKRSSKSFSWSKFYHGLDMQLPIYMLALTAAEHAGTKIDCLGGAFFVPIEAGLERITIDNLPRQKDKFKRKAKGIFNGGFFQALDRTAESQWSRFYNFYMTKDEPYGYFGTSSALYPEQFEKVLSFAKSRITELAANIFSGKIDITPYRLGTESACAYCRYRALCRFDWQINDYNFLDSISKTQILEQIGAAHVS